MPQHGAARPNPRKEAGNRLILGLFLALGLLMLLNGCEGERSSTRLESPGEAPDQILWDFTTTESDSGQLRWILKAEEAQIFQKAKKVEARGVKVDIYGEDQMLSSTLTADSGLFERKSGNMTAIGHVHVLSREDYELRTSILHWDRERELFHTEAFVEVRQGENIYTGYEMECDQRLEHLRIQREPKGVISDEIGETRG